MSFLTKSLNLPMVVEVKAPAMTTKSYLSILSKRFVCLAFTRLSKCAPGQVRTAPSPGWCVVLSQVEVITESRQSVQNHILAISVGIGKQSDVDKRNALLEKHTRNRGGPDFSGSLKF